MNVARRVAGEPLLHFLVLGALLFGVHALVQSPRSTTRIVITKELSAQLADRYRQQYGTPPSAPQRASLVERYIEEEMFYREALRLGLDQEDEIVRRRLVQKYEFLQQDLATPAAPLESELRKYYRDHAAQYRFPERISFTHVYFSPDRRGDEGARAAASQLAARLNQRGVGRAADQGDRYPGPYDFVALSADEVARVFGRDGLSVSIFTLAPGRWSTPLKSGFGWHTVLVTTHEPGREASFAEVRDRVVEDRRETEHQQHSAAELQKLRARFEIIRE